MTDSALRDIIPSNDLITNKKSRIERLSTICKVLVLMFILGIVAIGIVVLGLILTFSAKSFMHYIVNVSGENPLSLSHKTRLVQNNLTSTSDEQNWRKITLIPTSSQNDFSRPSSTKEEQRSTQLDDATTQEYTPTIPKTFTPTLFNEKTQNHETTEFTTEIAAQSSTTKKKLFVIKYKNLEDDHPIDDLLDS